MEYIVKPKLIKRKYKTIIMACGGDDCNEVKEIFYSWNHKGNDKSICLKCGRENRFEIPE